jgi:anti-sigma regulatory factor (Ser/Thr protein kinase)
LNLSPNLADMQISKIRFPFKSTVAAAMDFAKFLDTVRPSPHYLLDCQNLRFVSPFSLLFLSAELEQFKSDHPNSELLFQNYEGKAYAAHMGFFNACGLRYGEAPSTSPGGETYLPITILDTASLREEARSGFEEIGVTIERHSERFARMLMQTDNGDVVDGVTYSIREILRNIVEHSHSPTMRLCATHLPKQKLVEVAILDTGVGVRDTLTRNPHLEIGTDRDALNFSLLPGISGTTWDGKASASDDNPWANSGYGLYMTSGLCREMGTFFICSGESGIILKRDNKYDLQTSFRGTAIRMRVNTDQLIGLSASLARISKLGSAIQRTLKGTSHLSASTASRMLARDIREANKN